VIIAGHPAVLSKLNADDIARMISLANIGGMQPAAFEAFRPIEAARTIPEGLTVTSEGVFPWTGRVAAAAGSRTSLFQRVFEAYGTLFRAMQHPGLVSPADPLSNLPFRSLERWHLASGDAGHAALMSLRGGRPDYSEMAELTSFITERELDEFDTASAVHLLARDILRKMYERMDRPDEVVALYTRRLEAALLAILALPGVSLPKSGIKIAGPAADKSQVMIASAFDKLSQQSEAAALLAQLANTQRVWYIANLDAGAANVGRNLPLIRVIRFTDRILFFVVDGENIKQEGWELAIAALLALPAENFDLFPSSGKLAGGYPKNRQLEEMLVTLGLRKAKVKPPPPPWEQNRRYAASSDEAAKKAYRAAIAWFRSRQDIPEELKPAPTDTPDAFRRKKYAFARAYHSDMADSAADSSATAERTNIFTDGWPHFEAMEQFH
jgi:hypothetical protein